MLPTTPVDVAVALDPVRGMSAHFPCKTAVHNIQTGRLHVEPTAERIFAI
jgi:hypothetical protein